MEARAAQPYAETINRRGGALLRNFGGKVSGEWMLAKAAEIAHEAPAVWARTGRFIESGDWMVWPLTGRETRSLGFAAYQAQYDPDTGYPRDIVPGLVERLATPRPIGSAAGGLSDAWRKRTGIEGRAVVAVAVIDSHAVLPAIGAVTTGCLVGALGTSAVYLFLGTSSAPSRRDRGCREGHDAATKIAPGCGHLFALDWWSGNRVPLADSGLSGVILGLNMETTGAHVYRALMESICFGARSVADLFEAGSSRRVASS